MLQKQGGRRTAFNAQAKTQKLRRINAREGYFVKTDYRNSVRISAE
jgi:hypothetical protein